MLNDDLCQLLRSIPGVNIVVYADDIAILITEEDMKVIESIMNCALNILCTWTEENEMEVNTEKMNYQIFTMNNITVKPNLNFNTTTIEEVKNQDYLGIILGQRLMFRLHVNELVEKTKQKMKLLNRLTGTTYGASKLHINTHYTQKHIIINI